MLEIVEPLITASARKQGVTDDDILHAFNHPISYEDIDEGFVMITGPHSLRPPDRGRVHRHRPRTGHRAFDDRPQKVLEVMTMPRSLKSAFAAIRCRSMAQ